jgi:ferritin-like metal-binding protein YciE
MKVTNLNELFVHELKDLYDAEHQLVEALPKMAEAASNPELTEAFENHLVQTRSHVTRLEAVFRTCGEEPERETCKGMKGLIAEGEKAIKEIDDPDTRDAALISAAQRVEHYEIAAYGTLRVWALTAGIEDAELELQAILGEEKAANDKLTGIAETSVNASAEDAEEEEEEDVKPAPRRQSTSRSRSAKPARSHRPKSTR